MGILILEKTAYIHTLGCRLNSADSALLVSRLAADGYEIVDSARNASLIVINSCTVTAEASRKSRQAVRKFRQQAGSATIVVTGCSAELDRAAFLADGAADLVLTNPEKREIVLSIEAFLREGKKRGGICRSPAPRSGKDSGGVQQLLHLLHRPLRPGAGTLPQF